MHELSIVHRLLDQVARHRPPGSAVNSVHLRVGALQAIDPQAMQWAWEAATRDSDLNGSVMRLQCVPWLMHCPQCDQTWESADPLVNCECGCDHPRPTGDHELTLLLLEVEGAPQPPGHDHVSGLLADGQEVKP